MLARCPFGAQRLSVIPAEVLHVVGPVACQDLCDSGLPALVGGDRDQEPSRRKLAGIPLPFLGFVAERVLGEPVERAHRPALSVCGFDDVALSPLATPPITTIRFDAGDLGAAACEMLLARLQSPAPPTASYPASCYPRLDRPGPPASSPPPLFFR